MSEKRGGSQAVKRRTPRSDFVLVSRLIERRALVFGERSEADLFQDKRTFYRQIDKFI